MTIYPKDPLILALISSTTAIVKSIDIINCSFKNKFIIKVPIS